MNEFFPVTVSFLSAKCKYIFPVPLCSLTVVMAKRRYLCYTVDCKACLESPSKVCHSRAKSIFALCHILYL